jgi:hypothetical protein
MLNKEHFYYEYETPYKQLHEESYLDEIDDAERLTYSDAEILTGRNKNGDFNKFNNFGVANRGKPKNVDKVLLAQFEKFKYGLISKEQIIAVYDKIVEQALAGEFQQQKFFIERIQGKIPEVIKQETDITISFEPDEKSVKRMKDNKEQGLDED